MADIARAHRLARRLGGVEGDRLGRAFLKILIASAAMGVAAYYTQIWLRGFWPETRFVARADSVGGAITVAIGVLAVSAHALHIEEFRLAARRVLSRVRR